MGAREPAIKPKRICCSGEDVQVRTRSQTHAQSRTRAVIESEPMNLVVRSPQCVGGASHRGGHPYPEIYAHHPGTITEILAASP